MMLPAARTTFEAFQNSIFFPSSTTMIEEASLLGTKPSDEITSSTATSCIVPLRRIVTSPFLTSPFQKERLSAAKAQEAERMKSERSAVISLVNIFLFTCNDNIINHQCWRRHRT